MVEISALYTHLNTLTKQWFYDKNEIDTELSDVVRNADITDVVRTSTTSGLIKNDGTIDTNTYLTEHQDISNYIQKNATVGLVKNDGTIDTTNYQEAGDYIETSETTGLVKNDGTIDTNTYLTQHQDISGKADISDLHAVATSGSYTDLDNVPATFASTALQVTDANAHTALGTSAGATQSVINTAIDTKINALLSVELLEVVGTRPSASADTMNKMYLVAEEDAETEDAYEIFVTVEDDGEYSWEKVDTARIDLSGYASIDHVHGNITNDGKIGSTANQFVYTSTDGLVSAKSSIGNITTDGSIGSDTGKVVVTTTGGVLTTSDWISEVDNVIQQLTTYGNSLNS